MRGVCAQVLDVTARAVEETAARVLRLLSEKKGPYHPRIASIEGRLADASKSS